MSAAELDGKDRRPDNDTRSVEKSFLNNDQVNSGRTRRFELRLSEAEFSSLVSLEESLGMTRADLVRARVLQNKDVLLLNAAERIQLLSVLDSLGAELGRSGNNINQLARHANILKKQGMLEASVFDEFNRLFKQHIALRKKLEVSFRSLLRLMTRRR